MPMPAITTGIIHIDTLCAPAKSNAVLSIGTDAPPTDGPSGTQEPETHVRDTPQEVKSATLLFSHVLDTQRSSVQTFASSQFMSVSHPFPAYAFSLAKELAKTRILIEKTINDTLPMLTPIKLLGHDAN